jgi:hypothetical protein
VNSLQNTTDDVSFHSVEVTISIGFICTFHTVNEGNLFDFDPKFVQIIILAFPLTDTLCVFKGIVVEGKTGELPDQWTHSILCIESEGPGLKIPCMDCYPLTTLPQTLKQTSIEESLRQVHVAYCGR